MDDIYDWLGKFGQRIDEVEEVCLLLIHISSNCLFFFCLLPFLLFRACIFLILVFFIRCFFSMAFPSPSTVNS